MKKIISVFLVAVVLCIGFLPGMNVNAKSYSQSEVDKEFEVIELNTSNYNNGTYTYGMVPYEFNKKGTKLTVIVDGSVKTYKIKKNIKRMYYQYEKADAYGDFYVYDKYDALKSSRKEFKEGLSMMDGSLGFLIFVKNDKIVGYGFMS
ncbi:MAG: hypothetical protein K5929_08330 [Lachnospiraceae bacterium]|nr:hypothetical protein [Lachnospiraceae bacterium]